MSGRGDYPSLGSRVLRHVMVPLALTWMVGAVVASTDAAAVFGELRERKNKS